jgi:DNA invertase Pin-like site-specific DNA recombinase
MKQFISYSRVSTAGQGLGLEAQQSIIAEYVNQAGGVILDTISEKESGKETINRPGLQRAIDECKRTGATLIVAKLDRLSRDVADVFAIKKQKGLTFEVCDMDAHDTLLLGIFATLAQKERELISRRTREALAAKKIQLEELRQAYLLNAKHEEEFGNFKRAKWLRQEAEKLKLGNPNAAEAARAINARGAARRKQLAQDAPENRHAYNAVRFMPGTLASKAAFLNAEGYKTRNGKAFTPMAVKRLLDRYTAEN